MSSTEGPTPTDDLSVVDDAGSRTRAHASIRGLADNAALSPHVRDALALLALVAGGDWLEDPTAALAVSRRLVMHDTEASGDRAQLLRAEAQLALLASSSDAAGARAELQQAREHVKALSEQLASGVEAAFDSRVENLAAENARLVVENRELRVALVEARKEVAAAAPAASTAAPAAELASASPQAAVAASGLGKDGDDAPASPGSLLRRVKKAPA